MIKTIGKKFVVVAGAYVAARVARALIFRYEDAIIELLERGLNSIDITPADLDDNYQGLEDLLSLRIDKEEVEKIERIIRDFSTAFHNPNGQ